VHPVHPGHLGHLDCLDKGLDTVQIGSLSIRGFVAGLIVWLACQTAAPAYANQDTLSKVRELYLSADYEGALAALSSLGNEAHTGPIEIADYRVLCLLALDRSDEAKQAIRAIVEADPTHHLSEGVASPRVRTAFEDTRKTLLPEIVQRMYGDAKTAFDKHDQSATEKFDRLVALLDDPDLKDARFSDLRAVAAGFRDLSKAASVETAAPVPQTPVAVPLTTSAAPAVKDASEEVRLKPDPTSDQIQLITSAAATVARKPDTTLAPLTGPRDIIRLTSRGATPVITPKQPPPPGVEPPAPLSEPIPQFSPRRSAAPQDYYAVVEVTIDEQGNVTTVALQQRVQPAFDEALIKAARSWKFKPALLNGTPVPYVKVIEIQILADR
jgi:TonB family protein